MKFFYKLPQKFLYHTKLVAKYIWLLLILLFVEIFVINFYIRTNTTNYLAEEERTTSRQFLESYIDNITFRLSKSNFLLSSFARSEVLRTYLAHPELTDSDYDVITQEIRLILRNQYPYGFYDISFYPSAECNSTSSPFINDPSQMSETCQTMIKQGNFRKYFLHSEGQFNLERLSILYPVYSIDNAEIVCIINLSLFPQKIFKAIQNPEGEFPQNLFLINSEGELIYGSRFSDTDAYLNHAKEHTVKRYSGYPIDDYSGNSGVYVTSLYSSNGFRAVCYTSYEESFAKLKDLNRTLNISILTFALITITAGLTLSLHISHRFSKVLNKIDTVSKGNLNICDALPGTDEIGIFDSSFTNMVHRLQHLIETNYLSEMKKKDAQLMALQAQIQPHFLFNSLGIINSLIELEQYDTASEVNTRLSMLLRYSINYDSSSVVTVQDELNYMKDYLYIQNLRFRNKYKFHEQIDEKCLHIPILKLVLQPLAENSIHHGFQERSSGNIWFSVCQNDGFLIICLQDDGNGMSQTDYHALRKHLDSAIEKDFQEQNQNIGIQNIHHRLRLKYGSEYRMEIHTAPEQGMRITLTIPITPPESNHPNSENNL